jgi:hypothetical protein
MTLVVWMALLCAAEPDPPSLRYDVQPVLTRLGCNAGTCHGTPTGKNGFRLSLRGFDPAVDLQSLTREHGGRRVNFVDPAQSLILLKATANVPHEGGRRLAVDGPEHRLLLKWIAAGCPDDVADRPQLKQIAMTPPSALLDAPTIVQRLRVMAEFADGVMRDVTELCRFSVSDEMQARITPAGEVERLRAGETTVIAEYAGRFARSTLVFREPDPQYQPRELPERNLIDRHVLAKLTLLQIEPSPLCTDVDFLRRVTLDVAGRLPTPQEVRAFLTNDAPDRRAQTIDALLDSPDFADWWAMKWTDRLGGNNRFTGKFGAMKYHAWIRAAIAENLPEDQFARTLLTAGGPNYEHPPASFWRRLRVGGIGKEIDPLMATEEVSQLFLGVRIQCARCHNHPGENWTQDDFYGLAAFFAQVRFKEGAYVNHVYDKEDVVYLKPDAQVNDPRTGQPARARLLGQPPSDADLETDRRVPLADWLTAPENPWFARNSVNRLWFHVFGRGLIDPVDDVRQTNPPSHPELLDELTAEFVRSGFDRKALLRTMLNSTVYQLSSRTTPTNADDESYFSHARVRLLQAEQLLDAIAAATGATESFPDVPRGTRAVNLPDGEYKHPFLEAFGRPARALACECERDPQTNLSQALHLVSGPVVSAKLRDDEGRAAKLAASDLAPDQIVEELFLATLSRPPSTPERDVLQKPIGPPGSDRRAAIEDALWTLLNHREFLFQH